MVNLAKNWMVFFAFSKNYFIFTIQAFFDPILGNWMVNSSPMNGKFALSWEPQLENCAHGV